MHGLSGLYFPPLKPLNSPLSNPGAHERGIRQEQGRKVQGSQP